MHDKYTIFWTKTKLYKLGNINFLQKSKTIADMPSIIYFYQGGQIDPPFGGLRYNKTLGGLRVNNKQ